MSCKLERARGTSRGLYLHEADVTARQKYDAVRHTGVTRRHELGCNASGALYQAYRNYSIDTNEYVRGTADFYAALETGGFKRINPRGKRFFVGLRLKSDAEEFLV